MRVTDSILLSLKWDGEQNTLYLLDQTLLPGAELYRPYTDVDGVTDAIRTMVVRGAPAIGVAAGYGMYLACLDLPDEPEAFLAGLRARGEKLAAARPTAVNLPWAVKRMLEAAKKAIAGGGARHARNILRDEAERIHEEDIAICRSIGEALLPKLSAGMGVLTHCNAGQLATSRYGTALAPIYLAMEAGIPLRVYADETRPRLQGATLTALELQAAGADVTVLCDNMAAMVMGQGKIDCCIVGCDRVAANGDTANKIGTYGVAVMAKHFGIPFYVAAPTPTIDLDCADGAQIPIEERDPMELNARFEQPVVPRGVKVFNPAFDVTPHDLITAFATEKGLVYPPFTEGLRKVCSPNEKSW